LLVRECSSESYDGAFGGGVIEEIWAPDVRVYAGTGDDCVAAGHLREDVLGEEKEGVDVCGEGIDPLFPLSIIVKYSHDFEKRKGWEV
jgi:hypothetical protein